MGKKSLLNIILFFTVMLLAQLPYSIFAEENKEANKATDEVQKKIGLTIYVQGGILDNTRHPNSGENELRVFDHKSNAATLDLVQVLLEREAPKGSLGYKLRVSAGETAKFIHSNGLGTVDDDVDLTEAYLQYNVPLGKGLKVDVGKFATCHGAEVIEAIDNPNYSRSLLFNYAIPFTHTGARLGYDFSDNVNAKVFIVNGWDNFADNNDSKTLGISLGVNPSKQISMTFNAMQGPEQDKNNSDNRFLFDWVCSIEPGERWFLLLNYDYGSEQNSAPNGGDAQWNGFSGIVKYKFSDTLSLAVRGEQFHDRDGVRTGTPQTVKEFTITPEIKMWKKLIIRPEYRHDVSDKRVFDGGTIKTQDTLGIGIMFRHEW